ncbi:MAG TPA: hypothetical protein PLZ82_07550, partial [Smithellaceae bacterium]|nr:hypothetical protein [Smithellaceae bacterium]
DKTTGIKHLRVRGLSAVGCCARLKVIGVNLFRAARVKRALDALRTLPGTALSGIGTMIWVVKERFLNTGSRLRNIFNAATEITPYDLKIAA